MRLIKRAFWLTLGAMLLGLWFGEAKAITPADLENAVPERVGICDYFQVHHVCVGVVYQGELFFVIGPKDDDEETETYYAIYRLSPENVTRFHAKQAVQLREPELVWVPYKKESKGVI